MARKKLAELEEQFAPVEPWSMDQVITMDIETASLLDGVFLCYAIAWMRGVSENPDDVKCLVAETENELGPGLMMRLLRHWHEMAHKENDDWRMEELAQFAALSEGDMRKEFKKYLKRTGDKTLTAAIKEMDEEALVQAFDAFLEKHDAGSSKLGIHCTQQWTMVH